VDVIEGQVIDHDGAPIEVFDRDRGYRVIDRRRVKNSGRSMESGSDFSRDRDPGHPRPVRDPSPRTADYSQ
jgi:hypothetical protein